MADKDKQESVDPALLSLLDRLSSAERLDWLAFSAGGDEHWQQRIKAVEMQTSVKEQGILDIRRERTRTGETVIHLLYPEAEERVPCEVFRAALKLPSCPDTIAYDVAQQSWLLDGTGRGHGQGLSVERASHLEQSGYGAMAILEDAYSAGKVREKKPKEERSMSAR